MEFVLSCKLRTACGKDRVELIKTNIELIKMQEGQYETVGYNQNKVNDK
jgi:hypothetical protein